MINAAQVTGTIGGLLLAATVLTGDWLPWVFYLGAAVGLLATLYAIVTA